MALDPAGHVGLADRIEVEASGGGVGEGRMQGRDLPGSDTRKQVTDHLPLRLQISVVVVHPGTGGQHHGLRPVARVAHDDRQAGHVEHGALPVPVVRQIDQGDVVAEVADEVLLRPEGQPAHRGVQPVGTDDQVVPAMPAVRETDVHATGAVGDRRERRIEAELHRVRHRAMQDAVQAVTCDLDIVVGLVGKPAQVEAGHLFARSVEHRHRLDNRDLLRLDLGQDAHAFGRAEGFSTHVDRCATGA